MHTDKLNNKQQTWDISSAKQAIIVFAAVIATTLITVAVAIHTTAVVKWSALPTLWDGGWYQRIATNGYPSAVFSLGDEIKKGSDYESLAFYPLYPTIIKMVTLNNTLPFAFGVLVTNAISLFFSCYGLIYYCKSLGYSTRQSVLTSFTTLSLFYPILILMGYTETLFMALLIWSLIFLKRKQWPTFAMLAILLGLTRNVGIFITVPAFFYLILHDLKNPKAWVSIVLPGIIPLCWYKYADYLLQGYGGYYGMQTTVWGGGYHPTITLEQIFENYRPYVRLYNIAVLLLIVACLISWKIINNHLALIFAIMNYAFLFPMVSGIYDSRARYIAVTAILIPYLPVIIKKYFRGRPNQIRAQVAIYSALVCLGFFTTYYLASIGNIP